jgi:hypothetical protein
MRCFALLVALLVCWPAGVRASNPSPPVETTISQEPLSRLSNQLSQKMRRLVVMHRRAVKRGNLKEAEQTLLEIRRIIVFVYPRS